MQFCDKVKIRHLINHLNLIFCVPLYVKSTLLASMILDVIT